jgi:hypothetical protein
MIAEDEEREGRIEELRALFKKTQSLPQAEDISENMITEEIEEYRAGRVRIN